MIAPPPCHDCQSYWNRHCYAPQNAMPDAPGGVFVPNLIPEEMRGHGAILTLVRHTCGAVGRWFRPKAARDMSRMVMIGMGAWLGEIDEAEGGDR